MSSATKTVVAITNRAAMWNQTPWLVKLFPAVG